MRSNLPMLIVAMSTVASSTLMAADGVKNKKTVLQGGLTLDRASGCACEVSSEFEPILFRLTSLQNKYRVLRIRIVNRCQTDLRLSKTQDAVDVFFGGDRVAGVLDLTARDRAVWEGLDAPLREAIAYPPLVEQREEESIFVYVPDLTHTAPPTGVSFTVASVPGGPVELRNRTASAK